MSTWTTRADEQVGIGDLVALSLLAHSDAVGHIVAEADEGRVRCVLVRGSKVKPGTVITVEEEQLLVHVHS